MPLIANISTFASIEKITLSCVERFIADRFPFKMKILRYEKKNFGQCLCGMDRKHSLQ